MEISSGGPRLLRAAVLAVICVACVGTHEALAEEPETVAEATYKETQAERRMLCFGIGSLLWFVCVSQVRL